MNKYAPVSNSKTDTSNGVSVGSNIISARGEEWRCYRAIIQPGLQKTFETEPIIKNAEKLCQILSRLQLRSMGEGVPIQDVLQRYSSANLLSCIFDCPELAVSECLK